MRSPEILLQLKLMQIEFSRSSEECSREQRNEKPTHCAV